MRASVIAGRLGLAVLIALGASRTARADDDVPPLTREQVEKVVHDYLMREPEVLFEAAQVYKHRQEERAAAQASEKIVAQHAAIFDPEAPSAGSADAKVTLVEFFDFHCGYCRRMQPALQKMLAENSDVRIIFKDLPILGPNSRIAATAALAARRQRPERYYDLYQALFRTPDLTEANVMAIAETFGVDGARLRQDMADPAIKAELDANIGLAHDLGISGTPAFVLGTSLIQGSMPEGDLLRRIDEVRRACAAAAC